MPINTTMTIAASILALAMAPAAAIGTEEAEQKIEEIWESVQLDGAKVGFLHTTVVRGSPDSGRRLRATVELELTFKRQSAL
ncbi:MAG: hypothetical protein ACRELF_18585, partial [Gemmataceae bacterium]